MAMWTRPLRYQGAEGISLAMFFVRQGASKPRARFLPMIPPNTVRGKPTGGREGGRDDSGAEKRWEGGREGGREGEMDDSGAEKREGGRRDDSGAEK